MTIIAENVNPYRDVFRNIERWVIYTYNAGYEVLDCSPFSFQGEPRFLIRHIPASEFSGRRR